MSAPASPAPSSIFGRPNSDLDLDLAASMEQTRIADEDGTAFDAAIEELRDDTPDAKEEVHVSDVVAALSADSDGSESSGGSTTPTEVLEEVEMAARERDGVEGRWGDVIGLEVRGGGGDGEHGVGVAGRAGLLRGDVPGVEAAGVGLDEGDLDDVGEAPAAAVGSETAGSGCMDGQDDEVEAVVENQIYTMPGSWPEDDK